MKVVDVIPLSRGVFKETLTYFTVEGDILPGAIVEVPVRKKTITALVAKVSDASDVKSSLKEADFSLRKISQLKSKPFFLPEFIAAAEETARYFAGAVGNVIQSLSSKPVLESSIPSLSMSTNSYSSKIESETFVLQAPDDERILEYKSLIRESFARGVSVYLCFPTVQEVEHMLSVLEKGIAEYTFMLHGALPRKKILSVWKAALYEKHPVLIMGTGTFLSIPRKDFGILIVERESSRFYRSSMRPFIDVRRFAEYFAKGLKAKLIFGDTMLRVETLFRYKQGELLEFSTVKFRSLANGTQTLVDMRKTKSGEQKKFAALSPELISLINESREKNEHLFIFTARRGLSPITVCGDCGSVVTCRRCSAPVTLHKVGDKNIFICHHCGEQRSADERCRVCTSWKLQALGIGIELVEKEIRENSPGVKIFRMDKDSVKSNSRAHEIIEKFFSAPGSILLGTELALFYLNRRLENTAVVSIDSLFTLPDFRTNERIFSILLTIRSLSLKQMLVQSRNISVKVFEYAIRGDILDFYREEINEREAFKYPPFATLIKISTEGKKERVLKEMQLAILNFTECEPLIFPAFISTVRGKFIVNALLKMPKGKWVDEKILTKLFALPPQFKVQVDPENIV